MAQNPSGPPAVVRRLQRWLTPDTGASEVIGSILLVGITVALTAGIGVMVYGSIPDEEDAPRVDLSETIKDPDGVWGTGDEFVVAHHRGGPGLAQSQMAVVIRIGAGDEKRYAEGSANPLTHGQQQAFSASDDRFVIGERWRTENLSIPASTPVDVTVAAGQTGGFVVSTGSLLSGTSLGYVQTPLGMVTGTVSDGDEARSADGKVATLTEAPTSTDSVVKPADSVVSTPDFTPGSNVFASDDAYASTSHSAAVYSGSEDDTLRKIDLAGSQVWSQSPGSKVLGVAIGHDGHSYAGLDGGTVRKIDSTGSEVWSFTGHTNKVHDVAVDASGFVYSASEDNTVRKIDSTGSEVWSFTGHTKKVFGVAVDASGFVYSASEDNTVRKIDSTGSEVWSFTGHTNKVQDVAVDNDWRSIRAGFEDHPPQGDITQVLVRAEVQASSTSNQFRLEGCFSGGTSCTGASSPVQVGTTDQTITYDITALRPGGGSWTWSDVNDLEGIVEARSAQGSPVDLRIDQISVEVHFESGYKLKTDAWTFDPLGTGSTHTLEVRYRTLGAETYDLQVWDGTTWNSRATLDQSTLTVANHTLTASELSAGPQTRILDNGLDDGFRNSLEIDYARVVNG